MKRVLELIQEDFDYSTTHPDDRQPLAYDDPIDGPDGLPGWLNRIASRLVAGVSDPDWISTQEELEKLGWLAMIAVLRGLEEFARAQGDLDVAIARAQKGATWLDVALAAGYNSDRAARRRYLPEERASAAHYSRNHYKKMSQALQEQEAEQATLTQEKQSLRKPQLRGFDS